MSLTTTLIPTIQILQTNWASTNKELGRVDALAYDPVNDMFYVGGNFSGSNQLKSLAGAAITRNYLVAVYGSTHGASAWEYHSTWNPNANGRVYDIKVSPDGSQVYVAYYGSTVGGQTRKGLASLEPATGTNVGNATSLIPDLSFTAGVREIALSADGKSMWIGGDFTTGGGGTRLAKIDLSAATATVVATFNPSRNNTVHAVYIHESSGTLVCGGDFNDTASPWCAAFDSGTGAAKAFAYSPGPASGSSSACGVLAITGTGDTIWCGQRNDHEIKVAMPAGTVAHYQGCDGNIQANCIYQDAVISVHHGGCAAKAIDTSQANLTGGSCPNGGLKSGKIFKNDQATMALDTNFLPTDLIPSSTTPLGGWALATDGNNLMVGGDFVVAGHNLYRLAVYAGTGTVTPPPPPTCPPGTTGTWPDCVPIPTTTPPIVTITSPIDGTTINSDSVTVQADVEITAAGATPQSVVVQDNGGTAITMTPGVPSGPPDTQAPTVPTGLVSQGFDANGFPQLAWNASTDNVSVIAYNVYRNAVSVGQSPGLSLVDTSVAPLTTYSYTVTAVDGAGNESAASTPLSVTTPPTPSGGSSPTFLTGTTGAGTTSASASPPAGTTLGDIMLAHVTVVGNTGAVTAPSGWTLIAQWQDTTRYCAYLYQKTAGSAEGSATWSRASATTMDATITSTRNATIAQVLAAGSAGSSSSQHALPVLSGFKAGDIALDFVGADSSPLPYPRKGSMVGVMPNGSSSNWSDATALGTFETLVGRRMHHSHSMIPFDVKSGGSVTIPKRDLSVGNANLIADYNANRLSYVSWPRPRAGASGESSWSSQFGTNDPVTILKNFPTGTYDAQLTNLANALLAWEHATIIRLMHEMNQDMPWSIKKSSQQSAYAAAYIPAFQYIYTFLKNAGLVPLLHWNPGFLDSTNFTQESMWPGGPYVFAAGSEAYFNPGDTWPAKMTKVYTDWVSQTNSLGQPMIFGSGEGGHRGGDGTCYDTARTSLVPQGSNPSTQPQYKIYTQWDNTGPNGDNIIGDMNAAGQTKFKNFVQSSYMEAALTDTWVPPTGWTEAYQNRHPLGDASAKTNYGPGMQGHALFSRTLATAGSAPALPLVAPGRGRWAGFVVQLSATGGGGGSDTLPPTLNLTPGTDQTVAAGTGTQVFSGTVTDPSGVASLTVNGVAVTVAANGSFSTTQTLVSGANPFVFVAKDSSPNQNQKSVTVTITVGSVTTADKVAFIADFGGANLSESNKVINQMPIDASVAYFINGGDNYPRGANDAASPTAMTDNLAVFKTRGMIPRMIAAPGNHEGPNRDIVPGAGAAAAYQGYRYVWGNASGLAAGNAGHADGNIVTKTVNGWTLIICDTVAVSPDRTPDDTTPDGEAGVGSAQLAQIVAALPSSGDKCVVFGHHPRWNSDLSDHTDGTNGKANQLAQIQPLWAAIVGKCRAYCAGHAHNMQIHQPRDVNGNVVATGGTTQIVAGSGGGLNYALNNSYAPAPVFVDGNGVAGFLLLQFGATKLTVSLVGDTGTVLKSVAL